jgi:hypothetical protein
MKRGILASRDELTALQERIAHKPFSDFYALLENRCALILESRPMTEMDWQSAWAAGRTNVATAAARGAQGRIIDLLVADAIESNAAFRSRAREEVFNLLNWSTWVDPCHATLGYDICTAEVATAVTLGADWLWDDLDATQQSRIADALDAHVLEPFCQASQRPAWWTSAVNYWNGVCNASAAMVALAMMDESDRAESAYTAARSSLAHWFDALGSDGGWDEGIGYWGYAMRYILLLARAACRLADDQSLLHQRGMDVTGLFPIYFTPGGHSAAFGNHTTPPLHGALYLLDAELGCREITWWLDNYTFAHDLSATDWSQAGLALLLRPDGEHPTPQAPKLEPLRVFPQIGWAALADAWPRPAWYVSARAGDLAAAGSQRDMNSLQLQVGGEMMLTDPGDAAAGSGGYADADSDELYEVQARAHNTLILAEQGHRPDARGQILHHQLGEDWRYVICDAGQALGEQARFYRHILLHTASAGPGLLVLDELHLMGADRVDQYWHTGGAIQPAPAGRTGTITGRSAGLYYALGSTVTTELTIGRAQLAARRVDHYLQITGSMAGSAMLASWFGQDDPKSTLVVESGDDGATVTLGKRSWSFARHGVSLRYAP